jgi:O-antigen ligase
MRIGLSQWNAFLLAIPVFVIIVFFNKYIWVDSYMPAIATIFFVYSVFKYKFKLRVIFNLPVFYLVIFILYMFIRFDTSIDDVASKNDYLIDLIMYFMLFVSGALISSRGVRFSPFLWVVLTGYIIMVMIRNLYSLQETIDGYHLSVGIVIFCLLPFVLSARIENKNFFHIIMLIIIIFLSLIGARGSLLAILTIYFVIFFWDYISANKTRFALFFLLIITTIVSLTLIYLRVASNELNGIFSDGSIFNILNKRSGTRLDIWTHLYILISDKFIFGYGTHEATNLVSPIEFVEFSMHRNNLAAHSLYFELLYRSGVVGLSIFIMFLFSLWMKLFRVRDVFQAKVAGGTIIGLIILSSTSVVFIFTNLQIFFLFLWVFLGMNLGLSIKKSNIYL